MGVMWSFERAEGERLTLDWDQIIEEIVQMWQDKAMDGFFKHLLEEIFNFCNIS